MTMNVKNKIKVAILTGNHPYDAFSFNECFSSFSEIIYHVQSIEDFCRNSGNYVERYDVILFYNMTQGIPLDEPAWNQVNKRALEDIAERGQGIFVLHHALSAFKEWQVWSEICGIQDRKLHYFVDQDVHYEIVDTQHPITEGMSNFNMTDETYTMPPAGEGSQILITTKHPNSVSTIAWTRHYRNSKVFCFQSGHDSKVYSNENFRQIVRQGILWLSNGVNDASFE